MKHEPPALPYDCNALEPHYAGKTLRLRHGAHHSSCVDGLNNAEAKLGGQGQMLPEQAGCP